MTQEQIIEGNRIIDEFMEVEPVIEYCVGKDDSICYSPSNLKEYFPNSYSQKIESERWLKEQHEKYPSGWVTKEGYGVKAIVHYTNYHSDWNYLMYVVEKINKVTNHGHLISIHLYSTDLKNVTECRIYLTEFGAEEIITETDNLKLTVWQAVVEFIKFYNQNK